MTAKRQLIPYDDPSIKTAIPLSPAVRWGDLLFVSGHAAVDPRTLKLVSEEFEAQARYTVQTIVDVLRRAGSGPEHVLRVECFLKSATDFAVWNKVYSEFFAAARPARTTVVCDFVIPAMLIEIQVTAGVPS